MPLGCLESMQIWSLVVLGAGAEGHAKTPCSMSWMGEKELPSSSATPDRLRDNRPAEEGHSPPGRVVKADRG